MPQIFLINNLDEEMGFTVARFPDDTRMVVLAGSEEVTKSM